MVSLFFFLFFRGYTLSTQIVHPSTAAPTSRRFSPFVCFFARSRNFNFQEHHRGKKRCHSWCPSLFPSSSCCCETYRAASPPQAISPGTGRGRVRCQRRSLILTEVRLALGVILAFFSRLFPDPIRCVPLACPIFIPDFFSLVMMMRYEGDA